jgi:hypothetical protein
MSTRSGMKYRWKKTGEGAYDEQWRLYLILDGVKYTFAEVSWYGSVEKWGVFVSGFASEGPVHVEHYYDLLCDAKKEVLDYARVWWVSGVYQRMNAQEKQNWYECEL